MRALRPAEEIVVIGAGIAGLTAASHAARLGRCVTVIEGAPVYGGQIATVGQVDGLSAPGEFSGQDLVTNLLGQCRSLGVSFVEAEVSALGADESIEVVCGDGRRYQPGAVIVASGARARSLDVPGEQELAGRGVSRCATCDGPFFRNQDVVVLGGGDSAVHEARVLARICRNVTVVCRSSIRAQRHYVERLAGMEGVHFIWECEVDAILGSDGVDGVRLRNVKTGEHSELKCSGFFPFIGTTPNSGFLPERLLDANGYVECDANQQSMIERVFAAGAVRKGYGGDIAQAAGEGVSAAIAAHRCLQ